MVVHIQACFLNKHSMSPVPFSFQIIFMDHPLGHIVPQETLTNTVITKHHCPFLTSSLQA